MGKKIKKKFLNKNKSKLQNKNKRFKKESKTKKIIINR